MYNIDIINEVIHNSKCSQSDILLLLIAYNQNDETTNADIFELADQLNFIEIRKWNISRAIKNNKGNIIKLTNGIQITKMGNDYLKDMYPEIYSKRRSRNIESELENLLLEIDDVESKKFISEVLICVENKCYNAAVVLSWVGAVFILNKYVFDNYLDDFNKEAYRRNQKFRRIKTLDDFGRLKEYDFLEIISYLSVIGKNLKQELEQCLKLRNSCGHPNSLLIGENRVISHIEILSKNVYSKY